MKHESAERNNNRDSVYDVCRGKFRLALQISDYSANDFPAFPISVCVNHYSPLSPLVVGILL